MNTPPKAKPSRIYKHRRTGRRLVVWDSYQRVPIRFRWHVKAPNGRITGQGEGHPSMRNAERAAFGHIEGVGGNRRDWERVS